MEELVLEAGMRRFLTEVVRTRLQGSAEVLRCRGEAKAQGTLIEEPQGLLRKAFRCTLSEFFRAQKEQAQRTVDLSSWGPPRLSLEVAIALKCDFVKFAETNPAGERIRYAGSR